MIRPGTPQQTTAFVLLALVPGATLQAATFGDGVLANVAIAATTAVAAETAIAKLRGIAPVDALRDGSGLVTAVLLALALPPAVPVAIVIVGVLIAIGIGKHAFGGAGANPFNPAMVGYAALLLSFPAALALWPDTTGTSVDGVTGPTVLDAFKHRGGLTVADFWAPVHGFGAFTAAAWEWLNVAYLLGGTTLIATRVVDWRIPLSILASLSLVAAINYDGGSSASLGSPLFHCLSGGTMLGAFFVATDPVSSPTTSRGRIYYGVLIGVSLFAIRTASTYPDGIAFAVLLGNAAAPLIDRAVNQRNAGVA